MDRKERIDIAFRHLVNEKKVSTKKDVAILMSKKGKPNNNVYTALNGDERYLTDQFLMRFNNAFDNCFNYEWLRDGTGEMLRKTGDTSNIVNNGNNAIVGYYNNGRDVIIGSNEKSSSEGSIAPNRFGDSPDKERRWVPVISTSIAKQPNVDLLHYVNNESISERFYSGQIDIEFWFKVNDRSLEPYVMEGDYVGLKAMPEEHSLISPGDIYGVDTYSNGMKLRVLRLTDTNGVLACCHNKEYDDYVIPKSDIIRLYRKVALFRI